MHNVCIASFHYLMFSICCRYPYMMMRRRKSTITPPSSKVVSKNVIARNCINECPSENYRKTIYKSKSLPSDLEQQTKRSSLFAGPRFKLFNKGLLKKTILRTKSVSFQPEVLLVTAVAEDDIEECERILQKCDVDVNYKTASGQSLLHHAALSGSFNCIRLLIEHGANVNAIDCTGRSVLDGAVRNGHFDCAAELIHNGAMVEKLAVGGDHW